MLGLTLVVLALIAGLLRERVVGGGDDPLDDLAGRQFRDFSCEFKQAASAAGPGPCQA
jgi:hypothetical protein